MNDVLDMVYLTEEVTALYRDFAQRLALACRPLNIPWQDIPEEQAEVRGDCLVVYVVIPVVGRVEMIVPPEHWAWRDRN
jgi:hypothetical protein